MKSISQSLLSKIFGISLISLLLSACGAGSTLIITPERLSNYNGSWQSECIYISSSDTSAIETLYITDTEYTLYINEYDNYDCFGASDYETEIEGYLYFGDYRRHASNFCSNVIEVDFVVDTVYEDDEEIPYDEIASFLGLPDETSYDLMCTQGDHLYTGDLTFHNGTRPGLRPVSIDLSKPLHDLE